ncbi:MAG TPA: hypothetical protein PKA20_08845 [Burkholderiaceae bacterium]|nr:hypothetical protein [Burkholderiaceae bacterium]
MAGTVTATAAAASSHRNDVKRFAPRFAAVCCAAVFIPLFSFAGRVDRIVWIASYAIGRPGHQPRRREADKVAR